MVLAIEKGAGPCYGFAGHYAIEKLSQLVKTEEPRVGREACDAIGSFEGSKAFATDVTLRDIQPICKSLGYETQ
jgi:hypothetical protein